MPDRPSTADLFVYGTLRSQFQNPYARRLHKEAELIGAATVRGSIFHITSYPGYLREPDGLVHGELWQLREPAKTLAALDDYEGPEYARIQTEATADERTEPVLAWVYLYTGNVAPHHRIASGDFLLP